MKLKAVVLGVVLTQHGLRAVDQSRKKQKSNLVSKQYDSDTVQHGRSPVRCQQQGLILCAAGGKEGYMWIFILAQQFECKSTETFKQHHAEHAFSTSSQNLLASTSREEKDVKVLVTCHLGYYSSLSSRVLFLCMHLHLQIFTEFSLALIQKRIELCLFKILF